MLLHSRLQATRSDCEEEEEEIDARATRPMTNVTSGAVAVVPTTDAVHTRRTSAAHTKRQRGSNSME